MCCGYKREDGCLVQLRVAKIAETMLLILNYFPVHARTVQFGIEPGKHHAEQRFGFVRFVIVFYV